MRKNELLDLKMNLHPKFLAEMSFNQTNYRVLRFSGSFWVDFGLIRKRRKVRLRHGRQAHSHLRRHSGSCGGGPANNRPHPGRVQIVQFGTQYRTYPRHEGPRRKQLLRF